MTQEFRVEHRERVTHACTLAIQHAALLVSESVREFARVMTSTEALDRATSSLAKIRKQKRGLEGAELNLILAVEKLYRLHATQGWVNGRVFNGLLTLCWNGVGERLDMDNFARGERPPPNDYGGGPLQAGEQKYQTEVVMPLIRASFEIVWTADEEAKKQRAQERKLVIL
jgi:hypothetical protein